MSFHAKKATSRASARNVDLPLALLVGNSMSTSLLTSYRRQMETTLDPAGNATRAETATMLQRYMTSGR